MNRLLIIPGCFSAISFKCVSPHSGSLTILDFRVQIYTWKKATTTGRVSNSEFPQHSGSGLSIDNPKASLKSRSAQRAALAPVNRLSTERLDRRLQAKLPMQEVDSTEGKASFTGLPTPREFRFSQPLEKENL